MKTIPDCFSKRKDLSDRDAYECLKLSLKMIATDYDEAIDRLMDQVENPDGNVFDAYRLGKIAGLATAIKDIMGLL